VERVTDAGLDVETRAGQNADERALFGSRKHAVLFTTDDDGGTHERHGIR
jgi:hypothetical protein